MNSIKYLKANQLTVDDIMHKKVLPEIPFQMTRTDEFFDAVKFNNIDIVKQALRIDIRYLDQYDHYHQTPFHWAAKFGYEDILEYMLGFSKRCNIYDNKMRTPLYFAALNNHFKCVKTLIDHGGDVNLADKDGRTPYDVAESEEIKLLLKNEMDKYLLLPNEISKRNSIIKLMQNKTKQQGK